MMKQMITRLFQNGIRYIGWRKYWQRSLPAMPAAVQINAHVLDGVTNGTDEEVAPQGAGQADAHPGAGFIKNIVGTFEIPLMPVQIHVQLEFAIQKPRFAEQEFVILALAAQLDEQSRPLASAREGGRVEQIKVVLLDFGKTNQGIHRTESGAKRDFTGVLFLDVHHQVFPPGNRRIGRLRLHVDAAEILQAVQPLLADIYAHHVEDLAR